MRRVNDRLLGVCRSCTSSVSSGLFASSSNGALERTAAAAPAPAREGLPWWLIFLLGLGAGVAGVKLLGRRG